MAKRIIPSVLIAVVVIGAILLRDVDVRIFDVLVLAVSILSCLEFTKALGERLNKVQKILAIVLSATVIPVATFLGWFVFVYIVAYILGALIYSTLNPETCGVESFGYTLLSLIYPTVPLLFITFINGIGEFSLFALIILLGGTMASDVCAYIFGTLIKGAKLNERISPNKTVSGALAGLIAYVLASILTYLICMLFNYTPFYEMKTFSVIIFLILTGIAFGIIAQLGDLFESALKRSLNVKDMGTFLSGHGGFLDRVDSISFTAVAVYLLYSFL